jgi:translation initiation factor 2B subunit (eIF-2B alpha/beta/delta family)
LSNTLIVLTTSKICFVISFHKLPDDVRTWERDRANGAAFLARQAVALAAAHSGNAYGAESCDGQPSIAHSIAMLRPSMVPIVNVMNEFDRRMQTDPDSNGVGDYLRRSLDEEIGRCVDLGTDTILHYYSQWEINSPSATAFVVGTFSRSSTTKMILESILKKQGSSNKVKILCSRSTPGNEGELMAADFPGAKWLHDQEFRECLKHGHIDVVLVGADCIFHGGKGVVNKVGTESMAKCCKLGNIPIICCADTWKMWDDDYPPGLEDIFESFVSANLAHLLIPDSAPEARVDLLERGHGCWPHKNNSQEGKRDREVTEPL